ncbi:hypothetical protein ACP70R_049392 [Stipagrostis hirtigluma subsp. patula]
MDQQPFLGLSMSEMQRRGPEIQESMRLLGVEFPEAMGLGVGMALVFLYDATPNPPVSPAAPLASAGASWAATSDGVDRISRLPDQILRNVVSRLPAKDAARTAALASRWRGLWRSVPLVLVDAHILPAFVRPERMAPGGDDLSSRLVVAAASRALAAHPGPFRCVHLTWSHMASHRAEIARWLQLLADKGVQELAFINRPWPLDLPLPAAIFRCTSLTRLHLGVWRFPDTASLPRATAFPHLRELVLSLVVVEEQDLAFLLNRSPVLEDLTIIASQTAVCLRIVSRTLRCVQLGMCALADIRVVDAPRLERLFLWMTMGRRSEHELSHIKIGHAPNLRLLGHWQPEHHELEIGNTIIKAGTKMSASTMVPSVQMLALEVNFEARNEVKMVPCFLKCFPNVETLHVFSLNSDKPSGKVNLKLWREAGYIECVQWHVKKFVFQEFRGKRSELAFLKFIAESALVLEKMVVMVASKYFSSVDDVNDKLQPLASAKWASEKCKLIVFKSPSTDGASPLWCFRIASDFAQSDPFDLMTAGAERSTGASVLRDPNTL